MSRVTNSQHNCILYVRLALHAKYGLPPHQMTSKVINDIKTFSAAERKHWLEIKANDMNASKKRESAAVGSNANKKKRVSGGD